MNLLELVLKQMRQRSLGTVLTILSVLLGVALASAIVIIRKGAGDLFGQTSYGYDLVIGTKGSPLQLVVNTVYHISTSPGNIPYSFFEKMEKERAYHQYYRVAVPIAVGDSYQGLPIVGTLPRIFGVDDETLKPKIGYDEKGNPLPGFASPDASDEDVEANKLTRRDPVFEYKPAERPGEPGRKLVIADGSPFHADKFECVIGSEVAKKTNLKIGSIFQATHGFPKEGEIPDIHKPQWKIVGILEPTHTANDKCLFIPLTSFYCIAEHGTGLVSQDAIRKGLDPQLAIKEAEDRVKSERADAEANAAPATKGPTSAPAEEEEKDNFIIQPDGTIKLLLPKEVWGLSAIMVKARSGYGTQTLTYAINNGTEAAAANPATVMREFFANFIDNYSYVLLVISALVSVVAGIGILVSIYNSVAARMREIAILRALGATRGKVLTLICLEAGLIGLIGGTLGLLLGHATAALGSSILNRLLGQGIAWQHIAQEELIYVVAVVGLSVLAGLVPAMKAYRVPVAANLTA